MEGKGEVGRQPQARQATYAGDVMVEAGLPKYWTATRILHAP
jgi:hypothetical protein